MSICLFLPLNLHFSFLLCFVFAFLVRLCAVGIRCDWFVSTVFDSIGWRISIQLNGIISVCYNLNSIDHTPVHTELAFKSALVMGWANHHCHPDNHLHRGHDLCVPELLECIIQSRQIEFGALHWIIDCNRMYWLSLCVSSSSSSLSFIFHFTFWSSKLSIISQFYVLLLLLYTSCLWHHVRSMHININVCILIIRVHWHW